MTCRDVEAAIIRYATGAAVPPEIAAHIAGCEHCRRLVHAIRESRPPNPPPDHWGAIERAIFPDLKPVKPVASGGTRFIALALMIAAVAAIGGAILGTAGWRALSVLQRPAIFATITTVAALLAISLARLVVPGSKLVLRPMWLVVAGMGLMAAVFTILFHPHPEPTFVATGLVCLRIGLEAAAGTAILFWLALRRGAVLNPVLTGATAGTLAGLTGLTVLEIFCPNLNEYHVLVWHLGAALTSVVAGIALGIIAERSGS